ncbi:MAG: DNA polymerase III subunit alpha [Clostridia bacterium]|nr:DNA polymerase III subunit alpha [Clostridia bacterium]
MFAHLHTHTEYSLLDGANRIGELLDRVKDLGMDSCAVTDHGAMYGVVDFYTEALARGIHPVIGCEVYVCENMDDKTGAGRELSHLILLCETQEGYHNLVKLVSEGFTRGFYYKPRVDYALLEKYSKGLICLSACLSGDIPKAVISGQYQKAKKYAEKYRAIYGENNFFLEMQDHGLPEEKQALTGIIHLSRETGIPLVITNDCHYLTQQDAEAQEILMCIQTGKKLSDDDRMRMHSDQLYVKSEEEMLSLFPEFSDALERTEEIARRCHVTFDFETKHLPRYPLPEGETARNMLRRLCTEGLERKYAPDRQDARERLEYELGVIEKMGYVDYFLIVWDYINFARANGILVGPGRGSGAGSIVAYTLDITALDPLKYQLLFERFLNPERVSMPDLDIDFDYERRPEVIEYVARKYGSDHVAQIITFGTLAAKAAIKDVGRVLDMGYGRVDQISKMVPAALDMTIEKALILNPELKAAYDADADVQKLIDTARRLEGMPRHASTHAAGVLITARPVSDYVPLQVNADVVTTQFPMTTLEHLGLLKMDFLGLRTLNVIGDSLQYIREGGGPDLKPEDIPMDDKAVYDMISSGDTDGVFQLEGGGMRAFITNMKPRSFEDIVAAISLYRPGPMDSIPRFIQGKQDPSSIHYETPQLEPILNVTYGCMVYQEQVMQIVRDLAGYSMGRSDLVRRAMSKKKHDVMAKEKEYFIHGKLNDDGTVDVPGAVKRGVSEQAAEAIFDEMTAFASYAFNKSHAACYAVVAVQTAYLKCHYPTEFMAAMLNSIAGNATKVAYYIQFCRKNGISIAPPDVNKSQERFSVDSGAIRFGLNAVKNVGHNAIEAVISERREGGPYRTLHDFIDRLSGSQVNKKAVESLIKAGAFDTLSGNRAQKLCVYEMAMDAAAKKAGMVSAGQVSLFDDMGFSQELPEDLPPMKEYEPSLRLAMEKEFTGIYLTGHPLDEFKKQLDELKTNSAYLAEFAEEGRDTGELDGRRVEMGGLVASAVSRATKGGQLMAVYSLEDMYGATEVLAFPRVYENVGHSIREGDTVIMSGRLSCRDGRAPSLILDTVRPLLPDDKRPEPAMEERKPAGGKLFLKLSRDKLDAVKFILETTPGPIRVNFFFPEEGKNYLAPAGLWVSEDFDREALTELLGEGCVVLK